MEINKLEFESEVLSDSLKTQIILTYDIDNNTLTLARAFDEVLRDEGANETRKRVFQEDKKISCVSFSEEKIDYEIDLHGYVKLYGVGIPTSIIVDEDYYLLFSDKDKKYIDVFLQKTVDSVNSVFVNLEFENNYKFESLFSDKFKPSNVFRDNLEKNNWHEKLIYTNEHDQSSTPTKIFEITKDEKKFLYFMYSDFKDIECIVKYNNDIKEEVENMFYFGDLDTSNFMIFFTVIIVTIAVLVYYLNTI